MNKIGIFSIREQFSMDLLHKINEAKKDDIRAESALVGETRFYEKSPYSVIIDRVSSHVSYFKHYFKNASLMGAYVINNPFGKSCVDRFHNSFFAKNLGVDVPRMVCLPSREYHPDCDAQDLKNLKYPLDWEDICDFVGFPAILKPYEPHGFRDIFKVNNVDELIRCYNGTARQVMVMQQYIDYDFYLKTFIVGKQEHLTVKFDPSSRHYSSGKDVVKGLSMGKIIKKATRLCKDLDIDFCTVEFAVKDENMYAIDLFNPNPDCREESLTDECYHWCLEEITKLAIEKAAAGEANKTKINLK